MSKRTRFVITSLILSLGFVGIQFLNDQNRFWAIGILGALTFTLFLWSLFETIKPNMTLLTLVLPVMFTLGVGFFWFLLPANIFAQIPIVIFYGLGIYILCLIANIHSVASVRTIALLRAARGVGFVLTLITSFLVFDAILSLRTEIFYLIPLVFVFSFLLYLQGYWSIVLDKELSKGLISMSLGSALITTELAVILYFWPVTIVVGSLFLTTSFYVLMGLGQARLEGRYFKSTIKEHLVVGILIFIAMFISTRWGA